MPHNHRGLHELNRGLGKADDNDDDVKIIICTLDIMIVIAVSHSKPLLFT